MWDDDDDEDDNGAGERVWEDEKKERKKERKKEGQGDNAALFPSISTLILKQNRGRERAESRISRVTPNAPAASLFPWG